MKSFVMVIMIIFCYSLCEGQDSKKPSSNFEKTKKSCESGNNQECLNLGMMYALGEEVPRDSKKFVLVLDKACSEGLTEACLLLASVYVQGGKGDFSISKDNKKGYLYFKKACSSGGPKICFIIASSYLNKKNIVGFEFLETACSQKLYEACHALGLFYNEGKIVKKNSTKAKEYFDISCKGNKDFCNQKSE
jgi:TPR repeat protein